MPLFNVNVILLPLYKGGGGGGAMRMLNAIWTSNFKFQVMKILVKLCQLIMDQILQFLLTLKMIQVTSLHISIKSHRI